MSAPAGIKSYSYAEDKNIFRTQTQKWLLAIAVIILLFLPGWLSNYWLGLASLTGITVIALTGLNIITGYGGQASLAQAGFVAIGGYTTAILTGKYNQPFLVGLVAAAFIAGGLGALIGLLPNKIKWYYTAAGTFVVQAVILWLINIWTPFTGGAAGLNVISPSVGFIDFKTPGGLYFLIIITMGLAIFFANNLMKTRTGRAFTAVRDNPRAAAAMGINITRNKMFAFFIGCATAGISGALLAHWQGFITSGTFSAADSIGYIGVLIICGLGSIWSPVTGAIIFVLIFRVIAPALAGINLAPSENLTALTTVYALVITAAGAVAALRLRKKSWKIWM